MNGNNERQTRAAMQFLGWVERFHPEMAAAIVERVGEAPNAGGLNQLSGMFEMPSGLGQNGVISTTQTTTGGNGWDFSWATEVIAVAKEIVPAYLAYDAQKDIMELNMERARNGQEPIDPGMIAPQVRVIHDLPPETRTMIDQFKMGGINILLWGALAVGGFFLIRQLR